MVISFTTTFKWSIFKSLGSLLSLSASHGLQLLAR